MDAEQWEDSGNFSEDLGSLERALDAYDIIKDEISTATTVQELLDIKRSIGIVGFNSLKRFASTELLAKM